MSNVSQKISTFLMFSGQAQEAMNFYTSLFDQSEILNVIPNQDGTVLYATFSLKGQTYMCIDSTIKHNFTFTPAISLFVNCDTLDELKRLFEQLAEEGVVLMPLAPTPVSEQFAWVQDKFGVSWQLNLAKA